jgi:lipoate-protein ligase B
MNVKWSYLGVLPYGHTLDLMQRLRERIVADGADDILLMLQHKSVITRGNSEKGTDGGLLLPADEIRRLGIDIQQADRGGKTTFHGPGQLVGYLLVDLKRRGMKVKEFVHEVTEITVQVLDSYGISGRIDEKLPGVFVDDSKIAFFGFNVKNNVTAHGFSLNINNNLKPFSYVEPCGLKNASVTSMEKIGGQRFSIFDVYWRFITYFGDRFGDELEEVFVEDFESL